jgi:hypothetical protein
MPIEVMPTLNLILGLRSAQGLLED